MRASAPPAGSATGRTASPAAGPETSTTTGSRCRAVTRSSPAWNARGESDVDPLLAIWGEKGGLKDSAFGFRNHHAELTTPLPAGTYYVMAAGCCPFPRNRFESGSGTGAESQGGYRLSIAVNRPDRDYFAVDLEAGDVLGGTIKGARSLTVYGPTGRKVFGSFFDASSIFPS